MKRAALAAALLGATVVFPCPAFADGIQIIPPTPLGSMATCPAGTQQMLIYSGTPMGGEQAGMNCVPITADAQGDMEAQGYVQVGYTSVACDAAHAGAMRYNPSVGDFEGCNGAGWQPIGGSVPSGTICGMQTRGANYGPKCQGYAPYNYSCPPGYSPTSWSVNFGDGSFSFCQKD